ncbi:amino acid ABC transporter membrane protein (PAAT family) [Paenibacillus cellulosilyticus]|uniref:Amino acid ABC transporter membrane protein (PAAT family) n=1 Tax=Paenibacillus cellulosilyticus TaxID=375489 RepID=A0A2V2YT68_9BACL|nr:amino acid ABC transporter permease [Paenibacillus cellulosilyticus]PWV99429.1 amino acid ABC transporter membrane protein (PAAT family) [Paenibacillus cellulosilyticus]QKS44689.1 amino acid ABC transporter permease [Paenibacillus cellulosilyticus]
MDFGFLSEYWSYFLKGAWLTLQLSFFGVLFGTLLGVGFALLRISKIGILRFLASVYIEVIRGTPMLVQIVIIYYGLTNFGINLPGFTSGVIALTINSAAYMAEVFRAGINAIDKGQNEAARSLGMTHGMSLRLIVLPQAFRNMLPAIGNEFIVIIKDSSLVSTIGIAELMYNTNTVSSLTFKPLEPLLVSAAVYFVMTFTLSRLLGLLERKLNNQ